MNKAKTLNDLQVGDKVAVAWFHDLDQHGPRIEHELLSIVRRTKTRLYAVRANGFDKHKEYIVNIVDGMVLNLHDRVAQVATPEIIARHDEQIVAWSTWRLALSRLEKLMRTRAAVLDVQQIEDLVAAWEQIIARK